MDEITLHPFAKCKIFNIYVTSAGCGFLSIPHCSAANIIFIGNCCRFLRDIEVPEDAADKEQHAANVTSHHKFGFGSREGDNRLKLGFVCGCATCKLDAGTAKQMPGLDTGGPVRVALRNSNRGVVLWTIV
jgi:hypothetical protein